jgi:pimeloyl-ACP methyl ester carboxylesterase
MIPLRGDHYDVYGTAPPRYVLVHGVGGDRTQWRPLAQHLSTGAGLIAIDLAGHGAASHVAGPYRISRYAADVAEIANRYVSDGAILIAHSMGAAICLEAARILRGAARRGDWP